MTKKSGCPVGQRKVKGRCRPITAGAIKLTDHEADVLWTNLYVLIKHGKTKLEYPVDPVTTGFHDGKTEKQLLNSVKKKVDKIRP